MRHVCICVGAAAVLANPVATIQPLRVVADEQAAGQNSSKYPPLDLPESVLLIPDIAYGTGGETILLGDLFLPKAATSDGPFPAVVYIHGGAWRKGDRTLRHRCAAYLAERKIAGFSIEYRLSNEANFPAQVFDCKAAVRWLRANAERLNIDPNRIGVCGGSAGGHLSALLATTGNLPQLEGEGGHPGISTEVQAAVLFYGIFDMERPMEDGLKDIVSQFLGGSIEDRPALYQLASPIRHISAKTPPCIILYGDQDSPTMIDNSERFADVLHEAGVYRKVVIEEGRRHAYDLYEPDIDTVMQPVAQFLTTQFAINVAVESE